VATYRGVSAPVIGRACTTAVSSRGFPAWPPLSRVRESLVRRAVGLGGLGGLVLGRRGGRRRAGLVGLLPPDRRAAGLEAVADQLLVAEADLVVEMRPDAAAALVSASTARAQTASASRGIAAVPLDATAVPQGTIALPQGTIAVPQGMIPAARGRRAVP
jgi:hypothetical protein